MRAVVTGASAGIGAAFASRLARDGFDLVLVARRQDRLDALSKDIGCDENSLETLSLDLTKVDDLAQLERRIANDPEIDFLVNNAGFGTGAPFVEVESSRLEAELQLNALAVMRLTRAMLPGMLSRRKGVIVNVSSAMAFQPNPRFAHYGATKAYLNSFTLALSDECRGTGVQLQSLCPGPVQTEFGSIAGIDDERFPAFTLISPEKVVSVCLRDLARGRDLCVPGAATSASVWITRWLPRRLSRRFYRDFGRYFYRD
jgi:hypothetical protein